MSNSTYNINEEFLRSRFSEYEVSFEEKNWEDLEKELSEIKVQSGIPLGKIKPKFILIPIAVLTTISLLYINIDKLSGNTADAAALLPLQQAESQQKQEQAPVVKEPAGPVSIETTSEKPAAKLSATSTPSVTTVTPPVKKEPEPVKTEAAKNINPVVATTSSNSIPVAEEQRGRKKRKKRKNDSYETIESLRSSSLVPNSQDDDVVVPAD